VGPSLSSHQVLQPPGGRRNGQTKEAAGRCLRRCICTLRLLGDGSESTLRLLLLCIIAVFLCFFHHIYKDTIMYHVHKYASGGKTGPYFYCFFVDALANHVDGGGAGWDGVGGCINIHVDSKQKRLR